MRNWMKSLDRVLRGEATRPDALRGGAIDLPVGGLLVILLLLAAVYGACMGSFSLVARWETSTRQVGYLQMAASAAKVPMLFFLTLLITFPSLYVFNALVGSRLSIGAVLRLLIAAMAVALAVLASFGTIVVFFSLCTTSYPFMVLLNVVMFATAGLLGMRFLLQSLHRLAMAHAMWEAERAAGEFHKREVGAAESAAGDEPDADAGPTAVPPPLPRPLGALDRWQAQAAMPQVKAVFRIWVLVFGLVGAQMGWVLRPFVGDPGKPFTFVRAREGNFFEGVVNKIAALIEGDDKRPRGSGDYRSRGGAPRPPRGEEKRAGGAPTGGDGASTAPATQAAASAPEPRQNGERAPE